MKQSFNGSLYKAIILITALLTITFFISNLFPNTSFTSTQATTAGAMGDKSVIIDVRTLEEWNAGHLATAKHLPLDQVTVSIDTLVSDKNQQVYLYCRSGNRSGQAKIIMDSLGYTNVTNAGGLGNASELLSIEIIQ
jgi:phage shock protein E